ncbi:MAG: glycerol-3-phosphate 1-O-acyltransferase PlsY [Myxococcaceae bacterium]
MGAALLFLGYFCGSLPFGVWVSKRRAGFDPRFHGSGNIGATNVARLAGKRLGGVVLLLDALKGALPVWLATRWMPHDVWMHAAVGLSAFLGHVSSVWLGFRGGKGVATALGVTAVLLPWSALGAAVVYAGVLSRWRISALGSLCAGITAFGVGLFSKGQHPYTVMSAAFMAAMFWTHRTNLKRLRKRIAGG